MFNHQIYIGERGYGNLPMALKQNMQCGNMHSYPIGNKVNFREKLFKNNVVRM
jgi:hypothetical protein